MSQHKPKPPAPLIKTAQALLDLCQSTSSSKDHGLGPLQKTALSCSCTLKNAQGWSSISETQWPDHLREVATLRDPESDEPSFEEYHPNATHYDSVDAPVAMGFFPTNRCNVFECNKCQHFVLRYTEFGGYYVDPRARLLNPALIVIDPPEKG